MPWSIGAQSSRKSRICEYRIDEYRIDEDSNEASAVDAGGQAIAQTAQGHSGTVEQHILDLIKDGPSYEDAIEIPVLNDADKIFPRSPAVDGCAGVVDLDCTPGRVFKRQKVQD
jgi:hypothetical protein